MGDLDGKAILTDQIGGLRTELGRTKRIFGAAGIDPALRERVRQRIETLIGQQQRALEALSEAVHAAGATDLQSRWRELRAIERAAGAIFSECLALLQGSLGRQAGLDDGLCAIADALANDLGRRADQGWDRFTILADAECMSESANVIRLKFPGVSIWNLPIVGHEFGHFLGDELRVRDHANRYVHPVQELAAAEGDIVPTEETHLPERFADLVAVWALGPSPLCTCIFLRFDPATAAGPSKTHPSDAERVHLMLRVLAELDEGHAEPQYGRTIETLRALWDQLTVSAGRTATLDTGARERVDRLADAMLRIVKEAPESLRYDGWDRARGLVEAFGPDAQDEPSLVDRTLADVLNAAWLARITYAGADPFQIQRIGKRAMAACQAIVREAA